MIIKLYGFGSGFGNPDISPFVSKVINYLQLRQLPFEQSNSSANLRNAPYGKLPYIELDGRVIGDSSLIIDELEQLGGGLDQNLDAQQMATSRLWRRAIEEHLYWCLVYSRWIPESAWQLISQTGFKELGQPLRFIVPRVVRRKMRSSLHLQGLGRHSHAAILQMAKDHAHDLAVALASHDFFLASPSPTSFDASAYAFINSFISNTSASEFNEGFRSHANLVEYCQRMKACCEAQ